MYYTIDHPTMADQVFDNLTKAKQATRRLMRSSDDPFIGSPHILASDNSGAWHFDSYSQRWHYDSH